jgi:hypothetical protein
MSTARRRGDAKEAVELDFSSNRTNNFGCFFQFVFKKQKYSSYFVSCQNVRMHPLCSKSALTNVAKVSSWRAVKKLIEEVPTSLGHFIPYSFTRHRSVLVTVKIIICYN